MKKLAIAGLLAAALSLTTLSEQKAAAWGCDFNFSIGVSISCNWNCQPCCQPCWPSCGCAEYYPSPICAYGYAGGYGDCSAYAYPQAAPIAAPANPYGVQTAAYTYPTGYNAGYYQAPSYWYGR